MLTKEIDFFGEKLNVNVSSAIPLKYNFEFKKDLNVFLNNLMKFAKENSKLKKDKKEKKEVDFDGLDFEMLNSCNEVAYVMLKYAKNPSFKYQDYEEYLSNFEFMELATKSMEIATLYIQGTKPTFPPRTNLKKNKHKKGR